MFSQEGPSQHKIEERKMGIKETAIPAAELTLCKTPGWLPSENIEYDALFRGMEGPVM